MSLSIVFMGTPDLAAEILHALLRAPELRVVGAVTQPDQPRGRGLKLHASPVKELAVLGNLPVLQPARARDEAFLRALQDLQPDLIAVAAYGQILPKSILDLPRFGCLNVHTSLLPQYRGAAPIQRAILNGDPQTGVTIMKMDVGLDTGDILAQESTAIAPGDNSETLHARLAKMGAGLLVKTIPGYTAGEILPRPQSAEGVSYAPKILKQDGRIDWTQPAASIWNKVRALVPWPGAFTQLPGSVPLPLLKVWECEATDGCGVPGEILAADKHGIKVACGAGALRLLVLQREGGRRMSAAEFLAGHPFEPGEKLGA